MKLETYVRVPCVLLWYRLHNALKKSPPPLHISITSSAHHLYLHLLPALKAAILKSGVVRPLLKLAMHPGGRIVHRPAAVAIAGLAIGDPDPCHMKQALVEMGCIPPLVEMVRRKKDDLEKT